MGDPNSGREISREITSQTYWRPTSLPIDALACSGPIEKEPSSLTNASFSTFWSYFPNCSLPNPILNRTVSDSIIYPTNGSTDFVANPESYEASGGLLSFHCRGFEPFPHNKGTDALDIRPLTPTRKKMRKTESRRQKPLVRSQLRPASLDSHDGLGPRRRGRPPGSGNRKSMEPKFGPQGYKKFHSRSEAYTGVYRTRGGRWRAQFSHQGQVVQLGMFDDEKVAAHRWDLEAIRLRGPLTQLNLPAYKDLYIELVTQLLTRSQVEGVEISTLIDENFILHQIIPFTPAGNESSGMNGNDVLIDETYPYKQKLMTDNVFSFQDTKVFASEPLPLSHEMPFEYEATRPEAAKSIFPLSCDVLSSSVIDFAQRIMLSAEEDIEKGQVKASRALELIKYGEDLHREAQHSIEIGLAQKEEAKKLLHKFEEVLDMLNRFRP